MHEKTLTTRRAFAGKLLNLDVLDVEMEQGRHAIREIVRHPGGVTVLARLPDGRFALVRQFRKAMDSVLLEAVAGTLHPGEDPAECARRELTEETGFRASELFPLGVIAPAPGYTEERLYLYFARIEGTAGSLSPDEDEKIEVVLLTPEDIESMMLRGDIWDAKTLAAWFLCKARGYLK